MPKSQKTKRILKNLSFLDFSPSKYTNKYLDSKKIKFDFLHTDLIKTSKLVLFTMLAGKTQVFYNLFSLF